VTAFKKNGIGFFELASINQLTHFFPASDSKQLESSSSWMQMHPLNIITFH